jgi:hypothetical protein
VSIDLVGDRLVGRDREQDQADDGACDEKEHAAGILPDARVRNADQASRHTM